MLVLLTDGSANVPLRDEPAEPRLSAIEDELRRLGASLESEVTSVVIDTKSRFVSGGKGAALARMLGARYIYLPRSDAAMVYRAIVATAPREQRKWTIDG
jgi:Mg-chelatase subunit ChlD